MGTNEVIAEIKPRDSEAEVKALLDGRPTTKPAAKPSPEPGRRKMTAAGRGRIAAVQEVQWAKAKKAK